MEFEKIISVTLAWILFASCIIPCLSLNTVNANAWESDNKYGIGESLDSTGLKVVANYSGGTSKEIEDYVVGMVDMQSAGNSLFDKIIAFFKKLFGLTKTILQGYNHTV